ncbi:MAG: zinc ribbon domain-containing protein [Clostridia bacterium]|nr:zinc ribbon domain-containing protein [Clostridia bacterium]
MYCTNCGAKLPDDAKFCYRCGEKVAELPGSTAAPVPEKPVVSAAPADPTPAAPVSSAAASVSAAASSAVSAIKNIVPDASSIKAASSFSGTDCIALAAAVLSVVFAICSIKIYMTWLTLIAAILLAGLCLLRMHSETLPMAVPMTLFAVTVLVSSIRLFRYFKYYKFLGVIQVIFPLFFAIAAAVVYWLVVFKVGNKKKMMVFLVAMTAGYAILCITTSLTGDGMAFRTFASRMCSILFMIAYILRMVETSDAFAPALPAGSDVSSFSGGSDYVHYPHPYQQLGGYLKFTVIGGTIVAVLAIIGMIAEMIPVFRMMSYVSRYTNMTFAYIMIIVLMIFSIVVYALIIKLMMMIKNKDQRFLWFYHKLAIAGTLVVFVLQWISNGFGTAVVHLVLFFLLYFVYTLYFVKSVRVRTYMQSDEYLRIDPLTRKVKSPVPADIAPYEAI